MKKPESTAPSATITDESQCRRAADALLAEEEDAEEGGFGEEGEDAFHEQRLADHRPGELRESRPVGAELELHRDAGDDPGGEGDREDPRPEAGGVAVLGDRRRHSSTVLSTAIRTPRPIVSTGKR